MEVLSFTQFLTEEYGGLEVAKNIIKTLRNASFQAYLVGGCVRDSLLGRKPKDFDVATDARPEQVLKIFPAADKVGAHFGVVIERGVECATFRSDGAYGDARRPDSVHFEKSPREDASRRDFTCNAMFMDPFTGHVIDYFGGQEDIKKKVLRAVGDPYKRFGEDNLRMLRAMRFAAKLGFTIEPNTLAAMKGLAPHIKGVSTERVTQELTGAFSFPGGPAKSLAIMKDTGLLAHILPEVHNLSQHQHDVLENLMHQVHSESHTFALAALFSELGPNTVRGVALRLKLPNDQQRHIYAILGMQNTISLSSDRTGLDELKKLMRQEFFTDALKLYGMRVKAHDGAVNHRPFEFLTKLYAGMQQEDLHPEKFVNGNDLLKLGHRAGPQFKKILDAVEDKQLRGELHSKKDAIVFIQTHFPA
jgi:tRNA nucleotidyltransferase/poly(A) polymerase